MNDQHAAYALAHPVYDPERDLWPSHHWAAERGISACLSANIGME